MNSNSLLPDNHHYDKQKLILPSFVILLLSAALLFLPADINRHVIPIFSDEKFTLAQLLISLIFLASAWLCNTLLDIYVWHRLAKKYDLATIPRILRTGASLFIYLSAIIFILGFIIQKSIGTLLATTGAFGILIGFALRSAIEGVFNSLFVNIENTFRIGDIIFFQQGANEVQAQVIDISWRTTVLQDILGNILVIPNNAISSITIKKCSTPFKCYCYTQFFSINTTELSIDKSLLLIEAALKSNEHILTDPAPIISINDITDNKVKYEMRYWVSPYKSNITQVKHDVYKEIIRSLSLSHPAIKPDTSKEILLILQHLSLFNEFSEEALIQITSQIYPRFILKNEILIKQGDIGNSMFILTEGILQVSIKAAEKDEMIPVAKIVPGNYFSELSLLTGEPRSATIAALTDVTVYEITKEVMASLFEKNPQLIQTLSDKIANIQIINLKKQQDFSEKDSIQKKTTLSALLFNKIAKWFGHAEK